MWLMEGVTKEVRDVPATTRRQPPARATAALETPRDRTARQSPDGRPDGHHRLDRDGGTCREAPCPEAQECGGATAALEGNAGRADVDGAPEAALSGGGGADSVLRAGPVPMRVDRDGLDAGLHDDPGLRAASWGGRLQAHQRVSGRAGGGTRTC